MAFLSKKKLSPVGDSERMKRGQLPWTGKSRLPCASFIGEAGGYFSDEIYYGIWRQQINAGKFEKPSCNPRNPAIA